MGDAATAAAMAENDPEAQALVQEVTVATALSLATQGQVDLAIQDLTALRDKNPDLAAARLGLGKALVIKRQADAAIVELKKAVELDPKNAEAWYQLGYASYALKQDAPGALPVVREGGGRRSRQPRLPHLPGRGARRHRSRPIARSRS